jgi:hypothetical protein
MSIWDDQNEMIHSGNGRPHKKEERAGMNKEVCRKKEQIEEISFIDPNKWK